MATPDTSDHAQPDTDTLGAYVDHMAESMPVELLVVVERLYKDDFRAVLDPAHRAFVSDLLQNHPDNRRTAAKAMESVDDDLPSPPALTIHEWTAHAMELLKQLIQRHSLKRKAQQEASSK